VRKCHPRPKYASCAAVFSAKNGGNLIRSDKDLHLASKPKPSIANDRLDERNKGKKNKTKKIIQRDAEERHLSFFPNFHALPYGTVADKVRARNFGIRVQILRLILVCIVHIIIK
jgi:hypothetical protein